MTYDRMTIKHWASEDRPREKLLLKGRTHLSDAELIAILLRIGNKQQTAVELAQYILNRCGHDLNKLAQLSIKDLQRFKGVGEAKAITIVSALELGRRRKELEAPKQIKILTSTHAYDVISSELMDIPHEEFWILFLKRNNVVISKEMISKGGISKTTVDPKIIFKRALEESASGIILVHNHPSGNLNPSKEDRVLTNKIQQAGKSLDIKLLDHLIVNNNSFYSFADENLL